MVRTPPANPGATKQPGSDEKPLPQTRTSDPVLMLLHQKTSSAGAVGDWLTNNGYDLDIRLPTLGEELPHNLENHAGLIVFGGPMSANDDTPEIRHEISWLTHALDEKVPYFGICLGAQMMVHQLGGEIRPHADGMVEIGYHRVKATKAGSKLPVDWPEHCFQWHNEGFSLPAGATALATGSRFENQAFSYADHVFGVQFHPEINRTIIRRWSRSAAHMLTKKGAHNAERLLADDQKYGAAQLNWLHSFMDHWTSLIKAR